jgi:hypothetical protein
MIIVSNIAAPRRPLRIFQHSENPATTGRPKNLSRWRLPSTNSKISPVKILVRKAQPSTRKTSGSLPSN